MKAALITGATQGIGLALTRTLLSQGWTVFGVGRDQGSLDRTSSEYAAFIPIRADLTNNDDLKRIAGIVKDAQIPLNILVQNAGMKTPPRDLEDHSCEAIDEVISLNLSAPMKLTALLIPMMSPGSRILYVTSRAASLKLMQSSTYCATKAGLDEVAGIVRQELRKKNIAVGSVIPGEVDTGIQKTLRETPGFHLQQIFQQAYKSGQLIRPEICANYLKWLLCDLSFEEFNNDVIHTIYDKVHHKHWLTNPTDLPTFPFEDKS